MAELWTGMLDAHSSVVSLPIVWMANITRAAAMASGVNREVLDE